MNAVDRLCDVTVLRGTPEAPLEVAMHDGFVVRAGGIDAANRRVTAYASTGSMDSYETVFEPKAFKKWLPRFLKNPIVLGQHQRFLSTGEPPVIGKVVEAAVDDVGLKVTIEFDVGGVADLWWQRYQSGTMRGFSQTSQIVKSEWRDRPDGTGRYLVFTEVRLREISCVDIPSNDDALTVSRRRGQTETSERQRGQDARAAGAADRPGDAARRTGEDAGQDSPDAADAVQPAGTGVPAPAPDHEARLAALEAANAALAQRVLVLREEMDWISAGRIARSRKAPGQDAPIKDIPERPARLAGLSIF